MMSVARRRKWITCAAVIASALAVVALWALGSGQVGESRAAPAPRAEADDWGSAPSSSNGVLPALPGRSRIALEPGAQLTYSTEYSLRLEGDPESPEGWLRLLGTSQMQVTVTKAGPDGVTLVAQLSEPTLVSENPALGGDERLQGDVIGKLQHPFRIELDALGRVTSLAAADDTEGLAHSLVKLHVSGLQFVRAAEGHPDAWTAEETDSYGTYRAGYQRVEADRYEKRKLDYLQLSGGLNTTPPPRIVYSADIRHDGDFIRSYQSRERMEVTFGEEKFVGENYLTLTLSRVGRGTAPLLSRSVHEARLDQPLRATKGEAETARERRRRRIAGKSYESLSAELAQADQAERRVDVMLDLAALVEFEPAAIQQTLMDLKDPAKAEQRDILMGALASSESADAKNAVSALAADASAEPQLRASAATQVGLIEEPTRENVEVLERLSDSDEELVAASAALALGGAARRASVGQDADAQASAEAAVERLARKAAQSSSDEERRLYLDALGNAGSAAGADVIMRALDDPSEEVRLRAVAALRFVPGPEVDAKLLQILRRDENDRVRMMALSSIADRPLSAELVAGVFELLRAEEDLAMRREAVRVLTAALPREDAMIALGWALEHDESEDVRRAADQALATAGRG